MGTAAGTFSRGPRLVQAALVVALLGAGIAANIRSWTPPADLRTEDVFYAFVEGQRILAGEDPYSRVRAGDMKVNQKYATYFPAYYELAALAQLAGLHDFESWIRVFRWLFLLFDVGVFFLLLFALDPRQSPWLSTAAAGFWILNRWTLIETHIAHVDVPAIFFLLLSLTRFKTSAKASARYLGLSLALKQISVFVVPLYLIWSWHRAAAKSEMPWREVLRTALQIALIPLIASVPFLLWDGKGFVFSILFPFVRNGITHFAAPSAGDALGLSGVATRLPMVALLALTCLATWRRELGIYLGALMAIAIFIDFNPVLFQQYLVWLVPLIPLAALAQGGQGSVASVPAGAAGTFAAPAAQDCK